MDARFAIILAAGCACCAATLAGAEVAPGGWVDSRMVGSQLEMRDVTNGRALIARQGLGALAGFPAGVVTETTVVPAASGADVRGYCAEYRLLRQAPGAHLRRHPQHGPGC